MDVFEPAVMTPALLLGVARRKAPGPNARVWGGAGLAWTGAEGERVPDPVTPGIEWLGGPRGGTRCEGMRHTPAGPLNGGDIAVAPRNLRLRDVSLEDCEVGQALELAVRRS